MRHSNVIKKESDLQQLRRSEVLQSVAVSDSFLLLFIQVSSGGNGGVRDISNHYDATAVVELCFKLRSFCFSDYINSIEFY